MDTIKIIRDASGALRFEHPYIFQKPTAVTIGTFDGVHLGHLALINDLKRAAAARNLASAVVTFDRSPLATVRPGHPYSRLNSYREQITRLSVAAPDITFVLPFDRALSQLNADDFVQQVVVDMLHAHHMLLGYDHSFGHASHYGTAPETEALGARHGISIERAAAACDPEGNAYSSTRIKTLLRRGALREANQLLGYAYPLSGVVVGGRHLGRTLGYPTANIELDDAHKLLPPNGVYAARARIGNELCPGMLYIGNRPTMGDEEERSIEIHLFDRSEELYDRYISIEIEAFVHPEHHFGGTEQLTQALQAYEAEIRALLGCPRTE